MGLKKLFLRIFLLGIPFVVIVSFYVLTDPYAVIFPNDWPLRKVRLESSRDYLLTEQFFKEFPRQQYTAYIFGNSKTYFFDEQEWRKYIGEEEHVFCWGAPGESLYNIRRKLEIIVENGGQVNNALLVLDYRILSNTRNSGTEFQNPVSLHHPATSTTNYLRFEQTYLTFYLSNFIFLRHMDYTLNGKFKPYMKGYIPDEAAQAQTLQETVPGYQRNEGGTATLPDIGQASRDPALLIAENTIPYDSLLGEDDIDDLRIIMEIFRQLQTDYRIVFGPLLDGNTLRPENLTVFHSVFGKENVYDFTNDPAYIARPKNYLDDKVHYKTPVANDMMSRMYAPVTR